MKLSPLTRGSWLSTYSEISTIPNSYEEAINTFCDFITRSGYVDTTNLKESIEREYLYLSDIETSVMEYVSGSYYFFFYYRIKNKKHTKLGINKDERIS